MVLLDGGRGAVEAPTTSVSSRSTEVHGPNEVNNFRSLGRNASIKPKSFATVSLLHTISNLNSIAHIPIEPVHNTAMVAHQINPFSPSYCNFVASPSVRATNRIPNSFPQSLDRICSR